MQSNTATTDTFEFMEKQGTRNNKSNGWTPLVYPALALSMNPCFPLEKNVLRAAVRELLILDKSVDTETLELCTMTSNFCDSASNVTATGPLYLRHVDPSRWQLLPTEKSSGKKRTVTSLGMSSKKSKNATGTAKIVSNEVESGVTADSSVENTMAKESESTCSLIVGQVPNAEALTDILIDRSCLLVADNSLTAKPSEEYRIAFPRKISDADVIDNASSLTVYNDDAIESLDKTYGSNDISRFYDFRHRAVVVAEDIPPFMEVSIASEFVLRELARETTQKLTSSVDDGTLRMFLGYKSSTPKRDRLLVLLAEYLFDVSHAMFAWKQTEKELAQLDSARQESERRILRTLFDSRALRRIGGFDKFSLLPHALSISRLCKEGVAWKDFAKTKKGRALLQHHRNGKLLLAGQKRRGQRVRTRHVVSSSSESSETGTRSRSSSITSYDGLEPKRDGSGEPSSIDSAQPELWSEERQASLQMPDVLHVSLRKTAANSWGVLLSKEGDMCVVVRVPGETTGAGRNETAGLSVGDVILSVGNERQDSTEQGTRDWFRFVVDIFKSSNELDLLVRRVGSSHSVSTS